MLKMFKNKKAQNTAEYAILIALVVGGVIAMQTYAQRTFQGRLRDAAVSLRDQTKGISPGANADTLQYEPYYTNTSTVMDKDVLKEETYNGYTDTNLATKKKTSTDNTIYYKDAVDAADGGGTAGTGKGF